VTAGGFRRNATRVLSGLMVLVGVALIVRAIAEGGGPVAQGVVIGLLFVLAGLGRLWVQLRSERP
jgi:multisubunit Na+/H+ antiporter MnhB subunit